ncbi:hypothetical protein CANINC_003000, partial [Pichia inconspicua]
MTTITRTMMPRITGVAGDFRKDADVDDEADAVADAAG